MGTVIVESGEGPPAGPFERPSGAATVICETSWARATAWAMATATTSLSFCRSAASSSASTGRYLQRCATMRRTLIAIDCCARGNAGSDGGAELATAGVAGTAAPAAVVAATAAGRAAAAAARYCVGDSDDDVCNGSVVDHEDVNDEVWSGNGGNGREPRSSIRALPSRHLFVLLLLPKQVR